MSYFLCSYFCRQKNQQQKKSFFNIIFLALGLCGWLICHPSFVVANDLSQDDQEAQKEKVLLDGMRQAKINADNARAGERQTQEDENRTNAALNRAKTLREIQEMDRQGQLDLLDKVIQLENIRQPQAATAS